MNSSSRRGGLRRRGLLLLTAVMSTSLVLTSTPADAAVTPAHSSASDRSAASGHGSRALARAGTAENFVVAITKEEGGDSVVIGDTGSWSSALVTDSAGQIRCKYTMKSGLSFETAVANQTKIKNYTDTLNPKYGNSVTTVDAKDGDGDVGGNVKWNSNGFSYPVAAPVACERALGAVMDTAANSRKRQVAGNAVQTIALVVAWGLIAYATSEAGHPEWIGNQYFEAGAGCVSGMISKMLGDLVRMGKTDAWDQYAGKCLSTGAAFYGLTDAAKWIKGDPSHAKYMLTQVAKAARYAYTGTSQAISAIGSKLDALWQYILNAAGGGARVGARVGAGGLRGGVA